MFLSNFSVKKPIATLVIIIALMALGLLALKKLRVNQFPDVQQPVLVVNGDDDRMVPTKNTHDLARRLPNSTLIIYPDAGHGGIFQHHTTFVPSALEFLAR